MGESGDSGRCGDRGGWLIAGAIYLAAMGFRDGYHLIIYIFPMPRRPRLNVPGCLRHVMAHGIDGTDISRDDEDRTTFLTLFEKYSAIAGIRCYAWALMDNHYQQLPCCADLAGAVPRCRVPPQIRPVFSSFLD